MTAEGTYIPPERGKGAAWDFSSHRPPADSPAASAGGEGAGRNFGDQATFWAEVWAKRATALRTELDSVREALPPDLVDWLESQLRLLSWTGAPGLPFYSRSDWPVRASVEMTDAVIAVLTSASATLLAEMIKSAARKARGPGGQRDPGDSGRPEPWPADGDEAEREARGLIARRRGVAARSLIDPWVRRTDTGNGWRVSLTDAATGIRYTVLFDDATRCGLLEYDAKISRRD
jgi:hypothetical protein